MERFYVLNILLLTHTHTCTQTCTAHTRTCIPMYLHLGIVGFLASRSEQFSNFMKDFKNIAILNHYLIKFCAMYTLLHEIQARKLVTFIF